MLILMTLGIPLVELFGAQVTRSANTLQSARAHWIAEAGVHHAANEGAGIDTPVLFAGGAYVVSKSGDEFASTSKIQDLSRHLVREVLVQAEPGSPSPIDEAEAVEELEVKGGKKLNLPLTSLVDEDVVITAFSLTSDVPTEPLHRLKLDGKEIYHEHDGEPLPTGVIDIQSERRDRRTIEAFDSPDLEIEFDDDPEDFVEYTLVLYFEDGASSTLVFGVDWG